MFVTSGVIRKLYKVTSCLKKNNDIFTEITKEKIGKEGHSCRTEIFMIMLLKNKLAFLGIDD